MRRGWRRIGLAAGRTHARPSMQRSRRRLATAHRKPLRRGSISCARTHRRPIGTARGRWTANRLTRRDPRVSADRNDATQSRSLARRFTVSSRSRSSLTCLRILMRWRRCAWTLPLHVPCRPAAAPALRTRDRVPAGAHSPSRDDARAAGRRWVDTGVEVELAELCKLTERRAGWAPDTPRRDHLRPIIELERDLLAVADWKCHGEQLRMGFYAPEVVLQFVCVRGGVVRNEQTAGA